MKLGKYTLVKAPEDYPGPRVQYKYAFEHYVVYWLHHKVIKTRHNHIVHKNGIKNDNRIENLELKSSLVKFNCPQCNKECEIKGYYYRYRAKKNRRGVFCSSKCAGIKNIGR